MKARHLALVYLLVSLSITACHQLQGSRQPTVQPQPQTATQARLDFLNDVPEFYELHLNMTEGQLQQIIARFQLGMEVLSQGNRQVYHVWNRKGENVIMQFENGRCTGIQRMMKDPTLLKNKK